MSNNDHDIYPFLQDIVYIEKSSSARWHTIIPSKNPKIDKTKTSPKALTIYSREIISFSGVHILALNNICLSSGGDM